MIFTSIFLQQCHIGTLGRRQSTDTGFLFVVVAVRVPISTPVHVAMRGKTVEWGCVCADSGRSRSKGWDPIWMTWQHTVSHTAVIIGYRTTGKTLLWGWGDYLLLFLQIIVSKNENLYPLNSLNIQSGNL